MSATSNNNIITHVNVDMLKTLLQYASKNNRVDDSGNNKKQEEYIKSSETEIKYTEYKPNGVHKATKAESIRCYDDYIKLMEIYSKMGKSDEVRLRTQTIFTIGIASGLRISDIVRLRWDNFYEDDSFKNFRRRIKTVEKKTKKINDILITEVMKIAIETWRMSRTTILYDDYIFKTHNNNRINERAAYCNIVYPCKGIDLGFKLSTHTMRKSFLNIAGCIDTSGIDFMAFAKLQGLANHSEMTTTMRYMGSYQIMYDKAREVVSDFLLGKTEKKDIIPETNKSISNIYNLLERIEEKIGGIE